MASGVSARLDPGTLPVEAHLSHLRLKNASAGSVEQRFYSLRRLARFLGVECGVDLLAVTDIDLDDWQHSNAHLDPATRRSYAAHVSEFYLWALAGGLTSSNPALVLVRPKQGRRLPRPTAPDDVQMAVDCAPPRLRLMLVLAAYAGLRAGEIAHLTRGQVRDTSTPPVLVIRGKGDAERVVPMSGRVVMELRAHGLPHRGYVFPRLDGLDGPNTPTRVSRLCGQYLHGLGISEPLHCLRHYFGSSLYAASQDLRLTGEVMGHQSPATTAGYVSYSHAAAVEAVERVGAGLAVPGVPSVILPRAVADRG